MELIADKYKQTEVALIPRDWEVRNLGDLTEKIVGGGTPSRSNKLFWGNEIPWVTVKDFATFNKSQTQEYITKVGLNNSASNLIPKGIIITSTRMALGKAVIYDVDVSINQDLKAIFTKKYVDTIYLYYWFEFNAKKIEDLGSGSTVMGLSLSDLKKIEVLIPKSKSEQTAIATALSDMDALISSLEKLIEKKRMIKQGAMQELLKPKEGWELVRICDVAEVVGGSTPNTNVNEFWNGEINWFTPTEVGDSKYLYNSLRKISKAGLLNCSAKILPVGAILLTTRAGIGDLGILKSEACTNQGFQSLVVNRGYSNEFIYYLLKTMKSLLLQYASGSTFLEISPTKVRKINIYVPNYTEQVRIADMLCQIDEEIDSKISLLNKYRMIKDGMMQNLLTGKIRLI